MRIGVLSDTHIPGRARAVPATILEAFAGADLILHAGDLVSRAVLEVLRGVAPVHAVAGNNDPPDLVAELGTVKLLELGGFRIGLTHGHVGTGSTTLKRALSQFSEVDCVVFGHSHQPVIDRVGQTLVFNPGSATDRRRAPACSYGFLIIDAQGLRAELREIGAD